MQGKSVAHTHKFSLHISDVFATISGVLARKGTAMARLPIFARRVAEKRAERKWTQQELAKKAGVSYQTIWRTENGKHKEPGIYVARQIARALQVSLDYLVNLHGKDDDAERKPTLA